MDGKTRLETKVEDDRKTDINWVCFNQYEIDLNLYWVDVSYVTSTWNKEIISTVVEKF